MATFDEFITSLRLEFGEQGSGKPFEVFCKWFLENDPEWSRSIDKVWLWDEHPDKWQRQDLGTDLVFRDNEGLIWAVQAKCYGEHRKTTKDDISLTWQHDSILMRRHGAIRLLISQRASNGYHQSSSVGGSLRDVQMLAGHSSLAVIQRYIEGDSEARGKVVQFV
jgi:predicted helicase